MVSSFSAEASAELLDQMLYKDASIKSYKEEKPV
jgi:hypothetical protein